MTASRLSAELVGRGLAERSTGGRERFLRLAGSRGEVWESAAVPALPVLKEVEVCWEQVADVLARHAQSAPRQTEAMLAVPSKDHGITRALYIDAWRKLGHCLQPAPTARAVERCRYGRIRLPSPVAVTAWTRCRCT